MGTITINGTTFNIFGEFNTDDAGPPVVQAAMNYFKASLNITPWSTASGTDKQRALIMATRLLDKQNWIGTVTVEGQNLSWPRTGVKTKEGVTVVSTETPPGIYLGTYELAAALLGDSALQDAVNAGSNTKRKRTREKVGDLETELDTTFFVPTASGRSVFGRFPTLVQEYIRPFLPAIDLGTLLSGTDITSAELVSDFTLNVDGIS